MITITKTKAKIIAKTITKNPTLIGSMPTKLAKDQATHKMLPQKQKHRMAHLQVMPASTYSGTITSSSCPTLSPYCCSSQLYVYQ